MAVAQVDLDKEFADSLETVPLSLCIGWLLQRLVFMVLAGMVGAWGWLWVGTYGGPDRVAPKLYLLGWAMVIGGCGTVLYWGIKVLRGFPQAGATPAETLTQFYAHALPHDAMNVRLEAYVCLLDQAKGEFGSYKEFHRYWAGVRDELHDELDRPVHSSISYTMIEHTQEGVEAGAVCFAVRIKVEAHTRDNIFGTDGWLVFRERCSLARVGKRWYLTSGAWSGERE